METAWKILLLPVGFLAFFTGMGITEVHEMIRPSQPLLVNGGGEDRIFGLVDLALHVTLILTIVYFARRPAGWRVLELSKTAFLAILLVCYAGGAGIAIYLLANGEH